MSTTNEIDIDELLGEYSKVKQAISSSDIGVNWYVGISRKRWNKLRYFVKKAMNKPRLSMSKRRYYRKLYRNMRIKRGQR